MHLSPEFQCICPHSLNTFVHRVSMHFCPWSRSLPFSPTAFGDPSDLISNLYIKHIHFWGNWQHNRVPRQDVSKHTYTHTYVHAEWVKYEGKIKKTSSSTNIAFWSNVTHVGKQERNWWMNLLSRLSSSHKPRSRFMTGTKSTLGTVSSPVGTLTSKPKSQ